MNIPLPEGKTLLPYQIEGIQYALKRKNTLIADEMGLGKTVQAIAYINANPDIKRVLIVTPASLKLNWWNEIDEWLDVPKDRIENVCNVIISVTNYEHLKIVPIQELDLLIVDEAHFVKNAKSIRHKQIKRFAKKAKHVLFLTGTPVDNRPLELFPILQILDPETWDPAGYAKINKKKVKVGIGEGAGFFKFVLRYCNAHAVVLGKGPKAKKFWDFTGSSNLEELQQKLRDTIMIRRMKKDVLTQLPDKQHQIIVLPSKNNDNDLLPELNESNYEECIKKLKANKVAFTEFSTRRHWQGFEKVDYVVEHVKLALEEKDKIILFAHHSDVIEALAEVLVYYGCVWMTGETSIPDRQKAVDTFQTDPDCKIIIGSIETMGVGWTLIASSLVMFAEISTVPGKMAQAADRAHRIGQENSVLVQYLVQNGSIDARICKILIKKQKTLAAVLNPTALTIENEINVTTKLLYNGVEHEFPTKIIGNVGINGCSHPNKFIVSNGKNFKCTKCDLVMR